MLYWHIQIRYYAYCLVTCICTQHCSPTSVTHLCTRIFNLHFGSPFGTRITDLHFPPAFGTRIADLYVWPAILNFFVGCNSNSAQYERNLRFRQLAFAFYVHIWGLWIQGVIVTVTVILILSEIEKSDFLMLRYSCSATCTKFFKLGRRVFAQRLYIRL